MNTKYVQSYMDQKQSHLGKPNMFGKINDDNHLSIK